MKTASIQERMLISKKNSTWTIFKSQWQFQSMVIPGLLFIIVFSYIPMWGILMGFQDYSLFKGFWGSPWVGFKHFNEFINSSNFWQIMRNTIAISLFKLGCGFPAPIFLALCLNEIRNMVFKRVIQTISYLPHFIS
ncbi:MAG: sugar ABC transporter permease, partial [Gorillibacterium sp.]|nr:sugar ABC transporter permease [Gorillibacterium sp.]